MEANQDALEHIKWNKLIKSDKGISILIYTTDMKIYISALKAHLLGMSGSFLFLFRQPIEKTCMSDIHLSEMASSSQVKCSTRHLCKHK